MTSIFVQLLFSLGGLLPKEIAPFHQDEKRMSHEENNKDNPIPPNLNELIESGRIPGSGNPQMKDALKKTTDIIIRLNKMQDALSKQEIYGEAGGVAEPPPDIPRDISGAVPGYPLNEGSPPGGLSSSDNVSRPSSNSVPQEIDDGRPRDDALVRVVYKGSGQPLRVELNDECMELDKSTLESYLTEALWNSYIKMSLNHRAVNRETMMKQGLPDAFRMDSSHRNESATNSSRHDSQQPKTWT
eukprot:GHVQ01015760.1.p1 GENE.GHVQ01015760.1~~GHVQ01015760.1.p1  ORF type:complete len:243 (-),score=37.47 GHVQ01015760.1:1697-2425(-)